VTSPQKGKNWTIFIFNRSKIAPFCIFMETVEVAFFFVTRLKTLQILGVEMSEFLMP
jgi:hypothetical protein